MSHLTNASAEGIAKVGVLVFLIMVGGLLSSLLIPHPKPKPKPKPEPEPKPVYRLPANINWSKVVH